jgi:hypothetical protein
LPQYANDTYNRAFATGGRGSPLRPLLDKRAAQGRVVENLGGADDDFGTATVSALTAGLGILYALTGDGGAISVTVYDGDDRLRSYASTGEELKEVLDAVRDHAMARLVGTGAKPRGKPPK